MKIRTTLNIWLVISAFLLAMGCTAFAGQTIYVDASAPPSGDGTSWANAYNYLQDALDAALTGDEIWVAAGTYKPDPTGLADPREATFQLKNGVAIYGGFAGGETSRDQRDTVTNVTILSGDLNGDDAEVADPCDLLDEPTRAENSYHVVTGGGTDETAILDGFTVTAGNANESSYPHQCGGGLLNEPNSSPTLTDCTFIANSAMNVGGGMDSDTNSSPTLTDCTFRGNYSAAYSGGMHIHAQSKSILTNCTFSGNKAKYGGGLLNYAGSPNLVNCTFSGNSADFGGGMDNWHNGSATLTNCTFSGNSADYGGGMYNFDNSRPTLSNCTFTMNTTYMGGGMYNEASSPTLTNCTFSGNEAKYGSGGGVYNKSSSPTVTDCTFSGNSTDQGGGMANFDSSSPVVTKCTFSGNEAKWGVGGGGMCNCYSSPTVSDCTFSGNIAVRGGGMSNWPFSSPTVTNCTFSRNTAGAREGGGGMHNRNGSSPIVTKCRFFANSTLGDGGGMSNMISCSPTVTNCTFIGNSAMFNARDATGGYGGGMSNWSSSSPIVTNCTFSQNSIGVYNGGGGMSNVSDSRPTVTNCIFWRDVPPEIANVTGAYAFVTYSDVQGGYAGEGNIDTDPLFVRNPDDGGDGWLFGNNDDFGDLRLSAGSPCIDAGDNDAVPPDTNDLDGDGDTTEPIPFDLDGNPRFVDDQFTTDTGNGTPPIVDMGAYEFQGIGLNLDLTMDYSWMYQNLPGSNDSNLTACAEIINDPCNNNSYSYTWEFILPSDVNTPPTSVDGCGPNDAFCTFAAPGCDEPNGISDSGQPFTVKVTVTGNDYGNTGTAEAQFGIALLGDVNNDCIVNVIDRAIITAFWRTGSAGDYCLRDCDLNCDGRVNIIDRSIVTAIWKGTLGQNSVGSPCPFR